MIATLALFSYLQILDLLSTTAFLVYGVQEANPLVRIALQSFHSPLVGLVVVKLVAVALGVWCWWQGRQRVLHRMNIMFGVIVSWNLVALILKSIGS